MPEITDGNWLNQFVKPGLLAEFKNYKDDFITKMGSAPKQAISADGIRFNKLINNVGFLVNNTDDFVATKMPGQKGLIEWDKFDTTPTAVDDAEIRSLAFDKRAEVRVQHTLAWKLGIRDYALYKLAPTEAKTGQIIFRTTGEDDGTGRKRCTFADLIVFYSQIGLLNLPFKQFGNFILSAEHQQDLMLDKASTNNYREGIRLDADGKLAGFYEWSVFTNNDTSSYGEDNVLKARGEAALPTDRKASQFFYGPETVYHLNDLKLLYKPETIDTKSADPTSEFRIQTYGLVDKVRDYGFGALVSGIVEP